MEALLNRINALYRSKHLRELLLSLVAGWFIGNQLLHFSGIKAFGLVFILIFALCLFKINWAICGFIFLCPFHYVFKEIYPSVVTDLWREGFLVCILGGWFIQVCLKKLPLPPRNILSLLIVAYILWGLIEIFHSFSLIAGLAGFRFMFALSLYNYCDPLTGL